jgi:U3 small nucleolar RNA-associated protein 21
LLLALDEEGLLFIFNLKEANQSPVKTLSLGASIFMHPSTYLNKIVYSNSIFLYLFNINSEKIVYKYSNFRTEGDGEISQIEQSPIVDFICIGFSSGKLKLFNLLDDKIKQEFSMESKILSITFSSSEQIGTSLLASSDISGKIAIWDLNRNEIQYVLNCKNHYNFNCVKFINNEPILMSTSGDDNSIKLFLFERESKIPKLLKQRKGHNQNPHLIRFYGEDGKNILSASQDGSLRRISIINEQQNQEFSSKVCL